MPFIPDSPSPKQSEDGGVTSGTPGFVADQSISEVQHSTPEQTAKTFVESAIPGAKAFESADPDKLSPILQRLGPLGRAASFVKQSMGKVNPEDIRAREEANPIASAAGNITSLMTPGGEGALLEKVGAKALLGTQNAIPSLAGKGVLKGMSRGAVKLAAENAIYQGGDETTKMILNDPNQTVGSVVSNIGLAAGLGAIAGSAIGVVNPLWKAASETKLGELVSDFKSRMKEHLEIPEVPESIVKSEPKTVIDPFTKETSTIIPSIKPKQRANIDPFTKKPIQQPSVVSSDITKTTIQPQTVASVYKSPELLSTSSGGKLADMLVKNSDNIMSKGLAGAVGGAIGHMTGIPFGGTVGALIGERALGPVLKSVLPAIGKSILEKETNAEGFKAALDYSLNAIKGEKLTNAAIRNTFSRTSNVLPEAKQPSVEMRKKLDAALQQYKQDPAKLANISGSVGHYMPDHAVAIGSVASNAVNFLNSIKPQSIQRAPLDPPLKPSQAVQAQYDKVLDIAQQPLVVLQSIRDGTLTSHDVMALHTLYPDLYKGLREKVMAQMIEHVANEETIPYKTRLGLSMFLQQPLDSTMKPMAISLAQPQQTQLEQLPQQNQDKSSKKISNSASNNLIKSSKSAQTASQSSEAMHSTQKA